MFDIAYSALWNTDHNSKFPRQAQNGDSSEFYKDLV